MIPSFRLPALPILPPWLHGEIWGFDRHPRTGQWPYISSMVFSTSIVTEACQGKERTWPRPYGTLTTRHSRNSLENRPRSPSRVLSHSIDLEVQLALLGISQLACEMARLFTVTQEGAGYWLNAAHTIALELHLYPQEYSSCNLQAWYPSVCSAQSLPCPNMQQRH